MKLFKKKDYWFIYYGNLREGERYSKLLPKSYLSKKINLEGYKMYNLGISPGLIRNKSKSKNYIIAEINNYKLSIFKYYYLIILLGFIESVYLFRYKRTKIYLQNKKVNIYLYNWKIKNNNEIIDWKNIT
ncbi:hypothetical protein [Candidatus Vampirococcus lugosii]|uniref:Gamma-glutamylcyclotransferase AIG2-like domain-containing protein n=1 Tax=Candidatus Vampirococcus lugosii TaxID=2789015 RepID=A0ABS5QLY1_9BACT|nr:hypothetical protein [Candidatus Vampirococcus lugosii]MBS8122210.1 hypothetical protein [Candidatus Vampirococcus lugosii]